MTDTKTTDMNVENLLELNLLYAPGIFLIPEKKAPGQASVEVAISNEVVTNKDTDNIKVENPSAGKMVIGSKAVFFLDIDNYKKERGDNHEELIKKITSILTIENKQLQSSDYEIYDLNILNNSDVEFSQMVRKIVIFTDAWKWTDDEVTAGEKGQLFNKSVIRFSPLPEILGDSAKKVDFANRLKSYFVE